MTTYTSGITLKTKGIVTKNDIIILCQLLNGRDEYFNMCEFRPEPITEGGILFNFKDELNNKWYKSVRLCVNSGESKGKWYRINDDVLTEWSENNVLIFDKGNKFTIFLKSFHGAPVFTLEELKIWEDCFNHIGIVKVGKYPSKKSLVDK